MLVKGNPKTKFQMWLEKVNEERKTYHQQNYGSTLKYSMEALYGVLYRWKKVSICILQSELEIC